MAVRTNKVGNVAVVMLTVTTLLSLHAYAVADKIDINGLKGGSEAARMSAAGSYEVFPSAFIPNEGQYGDPTVKYVMQGRQLKVFCREAGLEYMMPGKMVYEDYARKPQLGEPVTVSMWLRNTEQGTLEATNELKGKFNCFQSNKQFTQIPTFEQLWYRDVYKGVDMAVYSNRHKLKYEFHLKANADPNSIQISYGGINSLSLDDQGRLHILHDAGEMVDHTPVAYQMIDGKKIDVSVTYRLIDATTYGFSINGDYNSSISLVIDPEMLWSVVYACDGDINHPDGYETIVDMVVDDEGDIYITGSLYWWQYIYVFPVGYGSVFNMFGTEDDDCSIPFITKLDGDNGSVVYSTVILEHGSSTAIAVDEEKCAYITGYTDTDDYPVTGTAFNPIATEDIVGFLLKLNGNGNQLLYSTFLDAGYITPEDIAVNENEVAVIVGTVGADEYICDSNGSCANGFEETNNEYGSESGFVIALDTNESGDDCFIYLTYMNYTVDCVHNDFEVCCIKDNIVYAAGRTANNSLATNGALYDNTLAGGYNACIAKIDISQTGQDSLLYFTYFDDNPYNSNSPFNTISDIALDEESNVHIVCSTLGDVPITEFALRISPESDSLPMLYVAKLALNGQGAQDLVYGTYLGIRGEVYRSPKITINDNTAYIGGSLLSRPYPDYFSHFEVTPYAYLTDNTLPSPNTGESFMAILSEDGSHIHYASYIGGGSDSEYCYALAVNEAGEIFLGGETESGGEDEYIMPDTTYNTPSWIGRYTHDAFICKHDDVILRVPQDYTTIQAAIDAAENGETVLVSPGEYRGSGNVDLDFYGKAITVQSVRPYDKKTAETTIINCQGSLTDPHRAFRFHSGETADAIVRGFTIINGYGPAESTQPWGITSVGGAIYCHDTSPTITNCRIINNTAGRGGGVYTEGGSPRIQHCVVESNFGSNHGGGIYCLGGEVKIFTSIIIYNTTSGLGGGIVFNDNNCSDAIALSTIAYNSASLRGGGLYCWESTPSIKDTIFWDNIATYGPEIALESSSDVTISYCTIEGGENTIYEDNSDATATYIYTADPELTPDGHLTAESPCIDSYGSYIFQENVERDIDWECGITAMGYVMRAQPTLLQGIYDRGADEFLDVDEDDLPDWWELYYFGDTTSASPTSDADNDGLNNLAEYELGTDPISKTIYVNSAAGSDGYDGLSPLWNGTHGPKATIQAAINAAGNGNEVIVSNGTYTGSGNRDLDFDGKAITVRSQYGYARCIINPQGTALNPHRAFTFENSEGANSIIDGFTITGGYGPVEYLQYHSNSYVGGAISSIGANPTINRCYIYGNQAQRGAGIFYYTCGTATVYDCVIGDNTASVHGGGIYTYDVEPQLIRCTLRDNTASNMGGGACLWKSDEISVRNCVMVENQAVKGGGLCLGEVADGVVLNATIYNNTGSTSGGGIYNEKAVVDILNSIVWGNDAAQGDDLTVQRLQYGDYGISVINVNYSNVGTNSEDAYKDAYSTLTWGIGNINSDPLFDADGLHLTSSSPCIDVGDPNGNYDGQVDIDGDNRVIDITGKGDGTVDVDMGADEYNDN